MTSLPSNVPLRFRDDPKVHAWLLDCWNRGAADGNALADALCGPLESAGLTFPGDVDQLLRELRSGPVSQYDSRPGAGWLVQGEWSAHLSEFGQSRSALLGSFGGGACKDVRSESARFHASCYTFMPSRECTDFAAWVRRAAQPASVVPQAAEPATAQGFKPGEHVRLTAKFLASTGQSSTSEARKVWTIQACDCTVCARDKLVAVNERRDAPDRLAEYAADPEYQEHLKRHPYRHVAVANLRRVK